MILFSKLPVRQLIYIGSDKLSHSFSKLPVRQLMFGAGKIDVSVFSKLPVRQLITSRTRKSITSCF